MMLFDHQIEAMWPLQRLVSTYYSTTRDGAQNTAVYMAINSSILIKATLHMKSQTVEWIAVKICQMKGYLDLQVRWTEDDG
jgi:hypothetical protein